MIDPTRKPTGYIEHRGISYAAFLEPDIAEQRQRCPHCGSPMIASVPAHFPEHPAEFVRRGGYSVCQKCGLTKDFCKCYE
jgi:hypothetical protein